MIVVTIARKPLSLGSTVAQNVLTNECGGYAIDDIRVGTESTIRELRGNGTSEDWHMSQDVGTFGSTSGRWPANLVLGHPVGCQNLGTAKVRVPKHRNPSVHVNAFPHGSHQLRPDKAIYDFSDADGNEVVPHWDCVPDCPVRILDEQGGDRPSTLTGRADPNVAHGHPGSEPLRESMFGVGGAMGNVYADAGGASRFFKQINSG